MPENNSSMAPLKDLKTLIVKAVYIKNLKMTEGKIASQIAHAVVGLGVTDPTCIIIVLGVSATKFNTIIAEKRCYVHTDYGYTEVARGQKTAAAWIENV